MKTWLINVDESSVQLAAGFTSVLEIMRGGRVRDRGNSDRICLTGRQTYILRRRDEVCVLYTALTRHESKE